MEPIEAIQARSASCGLIGAEFNNQLGEEIHRLMSVPPETGSSFTALLELPANQAMELLVHSPEDAAAAAAAENPSIRLTGEAFHQCPPPPVVPPIFPSNTALVDRAAKFSAIVNSDENSRAKLEMVKQEPVDSDSNPNSNSSPAVSNPAVGDQNPKSTKRKERAKKGKESNKKSKKAVNDTSDEVAGEKLPYVHVRARRGQATDSHSLAERARREKINARMKLLQELVPGCNKISGTAMVLDEIINHVQALQRQVEFLSMRLATVNPRVDINFDTLLAAESGSPIETNFPGLVMPSMWPEEQVHGNRQQFQQLWHLDSLHQPLWGREGDNSNFITPENSLLSYDSPANSGAEPNEFTFATVLTSCAGAFGFCHGRQIHSILVKYPFESHIFVGSSLLDMYAKAGRIDEARDIFEDLPEKDVVSCTAIISGYAQQGLDEEALELFRRLLKKEMNFNYVTYVSILNALSGLAAFEHGRQVHSHVLRLELPFYVVLQNSLIDMYTKCGNLAYSRRIFDNMSERTIISWNAMLAGYSRHGMGKQVVELFELLKEEIRIRPNNITILAVLSGCSHGGREHRGLEIFDEMLTEKDGVELGIEHYACVVDLLGRSGQVERALQFIKQMPFEPNAAIWGSLLGACSFHKNANIGEIAGNQLLEIEPENAGNYVILANLYASAGRWEEVRRVREMMKEKAMVKVPGKSWIEVEQTLHTFHASDRSHPRKEEIFGKVRELSARIKGAGYIPDMGCVLHDVDEEQKEKMLLGHSEKLALAFGLIAIPQGKAIRVIKNLRICIDCHNFAKFVSQVYRREVSLRDKARFHHITDGKCSCGDYW